MAGIKKLYFNNEGTNLSVSGVKVYRGVMDYCYYPRRVIRFYGVTVWEKYGIYDTTISELTVGVDSFSITRTSSPNGGAETGNLSGGSSWTQTPGYLGQVESTLWKKVYEGDVLSVTVNAMSNYYVYGSSSALNSATLTVTVSNSGTINLQTCKRVSASVSGKTSQASGTRYTTSTLTYTPSYTVITTSPYTPYITNNTSYSSSIVSYTGSTIKYRLVGNYNNTTYYAYLYYYRMSDTSKTLSAPELVSISYAGNTATVTVKNNNSTSGYLYWLYEYEDSSGDTGSSGNSFVIARSGSFTGTATATLSTSSGAEFVYLFLRIKLKCNDQWSPVRRYTDD